MEMKNKNKWKLKKINNKKWEEGPNRNKKWGILKYLSVKISSEKSEIIQGPMTCVSGVLGQKLRYNTGF